jgi:hypothetical protein
MDRAALTALVARMAGQRALLDLFDGLHELHAAHVADLMRGTVAPVAGRPEGIAATGMTAAFMEFEKNLSREHIMARWDRHFPSSQRQSE